MLKLEAFLAAHPGLAVWLSRIDADTAGVTATLDNLPPTYRERQAVALAHRSLPWKRQRHTSGFSWFAKVDDVTVVIPHAEALELSFEPSIIDMDKISGAIPASA